jgi:hypothetical protein
VRTCVVEVEVDDAGMLVELVEVLLDVDVDELVELVEVDVLVVVVVPFGLKRSK